MRQKTHHIDEQIDAYIDGELTGKQRRAVTRHLKVCESCRRKWQEKRILSINLRTLPFQSCPERVVERVMQQVQTAQQPKRWWLVPWPFQRPAFVWRLATGLTAAALILLLIIRQVNQKISPPQHRYSPEEIAQAKMDVEQTMEYLSAVIELTQQTIEQEVVPKKIMEPLKRGLHTAFRSLQKNGG